jgi:hypothetical protein
VDCKYGSDWWLVHEGWAGIWGSFMEVYLSEA